MDIDRPNDAALIRITGNDAGRFFAVKSYDSDGNSIDLLVNTTDPYDGILPLDFMQDEYTTRLEISAAGAWEIEILPLSSGRVLEGPNSIEGAGSDVIFLSGDSQDLATITGNAAERYFGVQGYNGGRNTLVNTTDAYEGTVLLHQDTLVLVVSAEGAWEIQILPLASARILEVPGVIGGSGDDIIILTGGTPDTATITGNAAERHFAVFGYNNGRDLIVNTTDPYEGTVMLHPDTLLLEIKATGPWSVEVAE